MHLYISYPSSNVSIDGNYTINSDTNENEVTIFGTYKLAGSYFYFNSGIVKIKDLGENKYKFTFSNVIAQNDLDETQTKTINGIFVSFFVQL